MSKLLRTLLPLSIAVAAIAGVAGRNLVSTEDDPNAPGASEEAGQQATAPFSLQAAWRDIGQKPATVQQLEDLARPSAEPQSVALPSVQPLRQGSLLTETAALQLRAVAEASRTETAAVAKAQSVRSDASLPEARMEGQESSIAIEPSREQRPTADEPEARDTPARAEAQTAQSADAIEAAARPDPAASPAAATRREEADRGAVSETATSALRDSPPASASDAEPPLPIRKTISVVQRPHPQSVRRRIAASRPARRELHSQAAHSPEAPSLRRVFRDLDYANP